MWEKSTGCPKAKPKRALSTQRALVPCGVCIVSCSYSSCATFLKYPLTSTEREIPWKLGFINSATQKWFYFATKEKLYCCFPSSIAQCFRRRFSACAWYFLLGLQAGLTPPAISQLGRKHSGGESTCLCVRYVTAEQSAMQMNISLTMWRRERTPD